MQITILDGEGIRVDTSELSGAHERAALFVLVTAGHAVSFETLAALILADKEVKDPRGTVLTVMSRLNRFLGRRRVIREGAGVDLRYRLNVEPSDSVDLYTLRRLVSRARELQLSDPVTAVLLFRHVHSQWKQAGPASLPASLQGMQQELHNEWLSMLESMAEVELNLAEEDKRLLPPLPDLVDILKPVVDSNPQREKLREQQMRALYRGGRKPEAIMMYVDYAETLAAGPSPDPGPQLKIIYDQVCTNHPDLNIRSLRTPSSDMAVLATGGNPAHPSTARMTNYLARDLPGDDFHLPIDRFNVELLWAVASDVAQLQVDNERFLRRLVEYSARNGIDQIIIIGGGAHNHYPAHKEAWLVNPQASIVYIHDEPDIVAYTQGRLAAEYDETARVAVMQASLSDPQTILRELQTRHLIDIRRQVLIASPEKHNYISDIDGLTGIIRYLIDAIAPGSHFALIMAAAEGITDLVSRQLAAIYENSPTKLVLRTREQSMELIQGLRLIDPRGIVYTKEWGAEPSVSAAHSSFRAHAVVAIKPAE